MSSVCVSLQPAAPEMLRPRLDLVEHQLAGFWAQQTQARILCRTRPVSFGERVASLPRPSDWRKRYVLEQRAMYTQWDTSLFQVDVTLAVWLHAATNVGVWEAGLRDALPISDVVRVPFPQLVYGRYRPRRTHLEPVVAGMPYLAVLTAYDVQGGWAPLDVGTYSNWHALLGLDLPLTLAIDVQTLDGFVAASKLRWALERRLSPDQRASAEYLQRVLDAESVHLLRYAVLLQGRTRADLDRMEQQVRHVAGRRLPLDRLAGAQDLHIRFFQDVPPTSIWSPITAHNTSSHGVGCKTPIAVRRQVAQRGVLLGTDMHERVPVHHEMFGADGRENANAVVVGTTGSGKTTFLLALALRLALQGYKIFFLDPTVMCRKLLELIGDRAAVAYHEVNERMAINILDRQSDRLIDQRDAVVRRLQTALGKPRQLDGRTTVTPYELTDREIGALDAALQDERIYGVDGHRLAAMTPDTAPLLQALATVLQDLSSERPDAGRLARRITDRLLGSASAIYNQPTELRFDPTIQVNLFSLRGVKKERLPLIYSWLFDNIRDYVWSPERDTPNTPVISILDEYFVLKSVPLLEEAVITDTKTGRGRQFGVITADQQAKTYYDDAHGSAGAFITGNARQKFFFYTDEEADLLASVYQNKLTPAHIMQLRTLKRGECLAMLDQDVRALQVELTPLEKRVLLA